MGRLTTHVLDTTRGAPAAGIEIELLRHDGATARSLRRLRANAEGRTDAPLLAGDELEAGRYELAFEVGAYFAGRELALPDPPFLDRISVRFGIADSEADYHVPLLVSPWAYSTYRGS